MALERGKKREREREREREKEKGRGEEREEEEERQRHLSTPEYPELSPWRDDHASYCPGSWF